MEEVLACEHGWVRLGECWTSEYVHVAAEDSSLSDEQGARFKIKRMWLTCNLSRGWPRDYWRIVANSDILQH